MVDGNIDGYYMVKSLIPENYKDIKNPDQTKIGIKLTLGEYVSFGNMPTFAYGSIQSGELISIDKCLDLYVH